MTDSARGEAPSVQRALVLHDYEVVVDLIQLTLKSSRASCMRWRAAVVRSSRGRRSSTACGGPDFVAESNIVDRHIRSLRVKLQNDYHRPRFIATVPGRGYRFIPTFSNQGWVVDDSEPPAAGEVDEKPARRGRRRE
jgi:Transcriptional regulatory protein, C terminal